MDQNPSLNQDDKLVFELLEEANHQFEDYVALQENLSLVSDAIEPDFSGYTWDRPLSLTIRSTKCQPGSSTLIISVP